MDSQLQRNKLNMLSAATDFITSNYRKDWFCLTLVGFFVFIIMLPILLLGIPDGSDLAQHLQFASTFYDSILSGDFFPGWASPDNHGFGSIGIRYYPPVAYYLMAFTQMVTNNWYLTFWTDSFFWMFLGCAGVYFLAKEWLSSRQAVLAAILYAIVPYHTAQIYQYLLYAEFAASGILPFCFLFATRIIKRGKPVDVLLFSISYALLILTHIPLTIIGSIGLGLYTLLLMDWKQPKKTIINFTIAFALSLSATAFHLLRAVTEVNWVKHNSPQYYANGYYDYKKYLFPMFYNGGEIYRVKMLWHFDLSIIFAFLLLLPLIIYLILQLKSSDKDNYFIRKIFYTLSITGIFALFIMSIPASFIWDSVSLLQKIQFPWRWLSLLSMIGAISFASAVPLLISRYKKMSKPIIYAALLLITSITLFDITQTIITSAPLSSEKFEEKLAEMHREPGCSCWWTIWAKQEAFGRPEKVYAESRSANVTRWDSELREFTVEAGAPENVRVATFYHPYWTAEINGNPAEIQTANDGSILIPITGEKSSIKLYFKEPFKLNAALAVSLLTWLLLFGALIFAYLKSRKSQTGLMAID
jgi:6-pyruvoyl-tetrahydropterin synthase related domain